MEEVRQGICGPHMNERMLAKKILRMGYYKNSMETNCVDFVKGCPNFQTHANLNHVPPSELYSMTSSWPFTIWGIDVIEIIALKASNGHEYILVAIDYFTKWVKAASYFVLKQHHLPVRSTAGDHLWQWFPLWGRGPKDHETVQHWAS